MNERTYQIRTGRTSQGYRAVIVLPSNAGEITLAATIPSEAMRYMREVMRTARDEQVGCVGCVSGLAELATGAHEAGIGGAWETAAPLVQAGISAIPIPGAGLIANLLPGVIDLFTGGPPPPRFDPNRPATLPPGGSAENLRRILNFVGVRQGMPRDEAARRLSAGRANRWNRTDFDDAEHLEAALEPGPVDIARVVARAIPGAPAARPVAQPAAQPVAQPVARPVARPAAPPPLPSQALSLAALASDLVSPDRAAAQMAANGAMLQASQLIRAAPQMFGEAAPDFASLIANVMDAGDTIVSGEVFELPQKAARLARSERAAQNDPRVREYLAAARGLHSWMHEVP